MFLIKSRVCATDLRVQILLAIVLLLTLCLRKPSSEESIWMSDCSTRIPLSINLVNQMISIGNAFSKILQISLHRPKRPEMGATWSADTIVEIWHCFSDIKGGRLYDMHSILLFYWQTVDLLYAAKHFLWLNISSHQDLVNSRGHLSGNRLSLTWKFPVQFGVDPGIWGWNQQKTYRQREPH